MNLEELKETWKTDSVVVRTDILREISRIPLLHSKYLEYMIEFRAKASVARRKLNALKNAKRRYYRGECTQEELKENGWSQYQGLKPSMSELNQLFELDEDLNELEEKLEYWMTALSSIEYIMKAIQSRGWELKTMVEYMKFEAGG